MKSGPGPEPHGGNRRCGGESPFFYLKALPRKKSFPRQDPTLRWEISFFLLKSVSQKNITFSMAGSDAAMENLVFPIKKRFPEKKVAFSTAGSDARFYKSYSCSIVLHFSSRIQLERLILQTLCSGFRESRCLFAFRDQLERLITQTRSVVQLYYCFPRGISWNA